ncbi:hypothetical protein MRX96_030604 [Rhipicephalus microplus]
MQRRQQRDANGRNAPPKPRIVSVPWRGLSGACISVDAVIFKKQWLRVFYGAIEHGDSLHLYYNMVSFIWKGMLLEPVLGSAQFAYIIVLFTALCGSVLLGLNYLLGTFVNSAFYYQCAVGFSGVIFALKVLNNCYFPGRSRRVLGVDINLPAGQVVWLELVLIQLVTPNASLVGHLAGILVGPRVRVRSHHTRFGPRLEPPRAAAYASNAHALRTLGTSA